jgi:adenylate cyclase class IV
LGWFVEIEYLSDIKGIDKARNEVARIMKELGFAKKDVVKPGYTKLLWDKKH